LELANHQHPHGGGTVATAAAVSAEVCCCCYCDEIHQLELLGTTNGPPQKHHHHHHPGNNNKTTTTTMMKQHPEAEMVDQLIQLEKNAQFQLNGICKRTKAAWAIVEHYEKTLESLQAQLLLVGQRNLKKRSSTTKTTTTPPPPPNNNNNKTNASTSSDACTDTLNEKIQETIGSLSMNLQKAVECDAELKQWGLLYVDVVARDDILAYYCACLQHDINDTTEQLQWKALAVFQVQEHLSNHQQRRRQADDETLVLLDNVEEEDESSISSIDHLYETFFNTSIIKIHDQDLSLDDTAELTSYSSSSSSSSTGIKKEKNDNAFTLPSVQRNRTEETQDDVSTSTGFFINTTARNNDVEFVFEV
jgi:hypothetical protein